MVERMPLRVVYGPTLHEASIRPLIERAKRSGTPWSDIEKLIEQAAEFDIVMARSAGRPPAVKTVWI